MPVHTKFIYTLRVLQHLLTLIAPNACSLWIFKVLPRSDAVQVEPPQFLLVRRPSNFERGSIRYSLPACRYDVDLQNPLRKEDHVS